MKEKTILHSDKAPKPVGPYSQAVEFDLQKKMIYTSGQVALNTEGFLVSEDVKAQTKQALENLKNILDDNGSSMENVIKATVFLRDMDDFTEMNEVYNEYFKNSLPARSTVAVTGLPKDARVEIEVISFKN
ncbi:MAG: Rid family detoxifying hydrolase [Bacteroidota bacterium]|nr:Rid family detoxifying hydrolase [Bacteroidota bacterium]